MWPLSVWVQTKNWYLPFVQRIAVSKPSLFASSAVTSPGGNACGASTTLKGAFDKDAFEKADADGDMSIFRCEGGHPFRHSKEGCGCYPRTVQRGASSVYFPVVYSSLVIPPYADKLNAKIESSRIGKSP